jgi:hypothetical protein
MAKSLILTNSYINEVDLRAELDDLGNVISFRVLTIGQVLDDVGNFVKNHVQDRDFSQLSTGVQADINGLMTNLSEDFNMEVANEPTATWKGA